MNQLVSFVIHTLKWGNNLEPTRLKKQKICLLKCHFLKGKDEDADSISSVSNMIISCAV